MEKTADKEKRLTVSREARVVKAISRIFPESREPRDPAAIMRALAKGNKLTILDPAQIIAIQANNQEGLIILSRFYRPEAESKTVINPVESLKKEGPAKYDAEILLGCLKIFSCKGLNDEAAEVRITQGHNAPIKLENAYFTVYLAPRISPEAVTGAV